MLNGFYAFPDKVVSVSNWKMKFEAVLGECFDDLPETRYFGTEPSIADGSPEVCQSM